jgi:hypothetical protein
MLSRHLPKGSSITSTPVATPLFSQSHIHTDSHPPVFAKSRRLDPEKLQIAKAEFKRLESAGIMRRSTSPWASPLHMVPKKDGSWRPGGDYRRLNLVTTPDKYPLPNMQDLSNGPHGCTVFSKIDLVKGYHQTPVAIDDIPKTAIITPFGLFEYLFTPFGLSNAAQTFQRMTDRTTDGLKVCLHTWTTLESALRTGKHTSAIWRLFSMLWLPMVWHLIWKSVFLQPPLLKSLATRFRRRERPLRPITPPKSKTARPLRTSNSYNAFSAW